MFGALRNSMKAALVAAVMVTGLAPVANASPMTLLAASSSGDGPASAREQQWRRNHWSGRNMDNRRNWAGRNWDGRRHWDGRRDWRRDRAWRRDHDRPRHYRGSNFFFGFGVPAYRYADPYYAAPRYTPRRVYRSTGTHVGWCQNRYRSYRAYDNTYQPYNGGRRQCISPYL